MNSLVGVGLMIGGGLVLVLGLVDLRRGHRYGRLRTLTGVVILVSGIYMILQP